MIWLVGLGSALGGMARFLVGGWLERSSTSFPWATLLINVTGSFLLGWIMRYSLSVPVRREVLVFLTIGVCGGYTTFSTFSYETLNLLRDAQYARAGGYALASMVLSLTAVLAGFTLARQTISHP